MQITLKVCLRSAPMLSGCRNSWPSIICVTAFAPGTTSPSIAVVRKTLFPHTTGDECPRPAIGVFHLMFLLAFHSAGRFVSVETPLPFGPRHCGQLAAPAVAANQATPERENIRKLILIVEAVLMLISIPLFIAKCVLRPYFV